MFISENLYILPPLLKHYEPVDGSDNRYLNHSHVPSVSPLNKDDDDCSSVAPIDLHISLLHSNCLFLFNVLPGIHLNLVGFWYKLTLTRHTNWT